MWNSSKYPYPFDQQGKIAECQSLLIWDPTLAKQLNDTPTLPEITAIASSWRDLITAQLFPRESCVLYQNSWLICDTLEILKQLSLSDIIAYDVNDANLFIYKFRKYKKGTCGNASGHFMSLPNITSLMLFFSGGWVSVMRLGGLLMRVISY